MRWCYTLNDDTNPAERDVACTDCVTPNQFKRPFGHGVDANKNRDSVGHASSTAESLPVRACTISRI